MFPGVRLVLATWLLTTTMFLSCTTHTTAPAPSPIHPAPHADSPAHAVEAFRWSWQNPSFETYRTLFTDDYTFEFAVLDSNGSLYRSAPWTRDDELQSFTHLVSGGGQSEPVASILLTLGTLVVGEDPRPGMNDPERRRLATASCALRIETSDGSVSQVTGKLRLFLVRGDLANLPADLGRTADAGTWYIERWEDGTGSITGASEAQPAEASSWGSIKARYRDAATIASRP
jgi:hypothetical protein